MKKGKKSIIVILTAVLIGILAFGVWFFLLPKGGKVKGQANIWEQEENWTYAYRKGWQKCVLISWQWDGDPDNMTIEIPESLGGKTVVSLSQKDTILGPFSVRMPADYEEAVNTQTSDEGVIPEGDSYDTYVFHVILTDAIEYVSCEDTWYGSFDEEDPESEPDWLYKIEYIWE